MENRRCAFPLIPRCRRQLEMNVKGQSVALRQTGPYSFLGQSKKSSLAAYGNSRKPSGARRREAAGALL
ncbi:MAG: hypothetical protein JSS32_04070 [Verrucomicrobia bacterium]|nr:hypothetical protein [Verrucomicrobiota bacterium]